VRETGSRSTEEDRTMIMTKSAYRGHEVVSLRNIRPVAAPVVEIEMEDAYTILRTAAGVRCGNHGRVARGHEVRHANTASVRACYQLTAEMNAQQAAEIAVEQGYERYLENRGYDEARDEEDREFWGAVNHW
jgi:hypothetical protein